MISRERRRRRAPVVLGAAAVALCVQAVSARAAWGAPLFALADRSDVVVRGTVEGVQAYRQGTLQVFTIRPERVLAGTATVGAPIALVQELVFASERPYFDAGVSVLVFAVPLPNYSSYRKVLPEGTYLRWAERKDTAADIAALAAPEFTQPLADYLALRNDPPALARHLAGLLAAEPARLRADAMTALEARPALASLLDTRALAPLAATLDDDHRSLAERGQMLVRLGRLRASGVAALATQILANRGPLEAAALEVLVTVGASPSEEQLVAYTHRDDVAVRLAAVRGLARVDSARALTRVAEIVHDDPADEVRLAALEALGGRTDEGTVKLLAEALREQNRGRINAAATALARTGNPAAIAALADALEHGSFETQTAAAFALKQSGKDQAVAVLQEQVGSHPDPRVRKVIALALGRAPDEHE